MDPIEATYVAAVAACVLVFALRVGIAWLRHNRQRDDLDREPRCGTCGYIVAKCTSAICPECGRDVREHGLISSRARPRIGLAPLYLLLTLVAFPAAIRMGMVLAQWQPLLGWRYHCSQMVALPRDDGSFGAPRYAVQSEGSGRYFARRPDYVWVYCNTGGDGHPMLIVDLQARQFRLVDNAGNQSSAQSMDAMQVCKFLRIRSPTDSHAQLMNASERIVSSVRDQMVGNIPSGELRTSDLWNGTSLSYSVAGGVSFGIMLLSWASLSISLLLITSLLKRRSSRKRRQLWREEVERLGLARSI